MRRLNKNRLNKNNINQYNINTINYITNIMNEADFIQQIMSQANLNEEQGGMVNEIFQSNFIGGDKNKNMIVNLIAEKLGVDKARAKDIYAIGVTVLTTTGILDKIKGIFKR
jgi:hypothetical protein